MLIHCRQTNGAKQMRRFFTMLASLMALLITSSGPGSAQLVSEQVVFEEMQKLADKGEPEAEYHLGMFYNNGIGTTADPGKAFEWFQKSAEGGDPLGAFKLGCYYAGQFPGVVPVDAEMALKYKLVAAQQGYDLAQLDVGRHQYDRKEFAEAIRWWTAAAGQGEPSSMYHLSAAYAQGDVVATDRVASLRYLDALRRMPEFSGDTTLADAFSALTKSMSTAELEAASSAGSLKIGPSTLTLKAREGLSRAKIYLAENMR